MKGRRDKARALSSMKKGPQALLSCGYSRNDCEGASMNLVNEMSYLPYELLPRDGECNDFFSLLVHEFACAWEKDEGSSIVARKRPEEKG
jgi:hypothetical protein